MSIESRPTVDPPDAAAEALLRAAAWAADRGERTDRSALRDIAVPDDRRLDERTRAALLERLAAVAAPVERHLRLGAARRLSEMQAARAAERLLDDPEPLAPALATLAAAGDAAILAELLAIVRMEALAAALPAGPSVAPDRPSLLVRLTDRPEADVARAAAALLAAQSRQTLDTPPALPPAMRERIVWWIAALLRRRLQDDPRADHALIEAAMAALDDEDVPAEPPEPAAIRVAASIRAQPGDLPALLLEALGDRQPALFVALLALAGGLAFGAARTLAIDPAGDRLWLLLRALGVDRSTIARIGVALADADPRRDLERFAVALDAVMTIAPERASEAFAPLAMPADYRDALAAVAALR